VLNARTANPEESTLTDDTGDQDEAIIDALRESCIDPDLGVNVVDLGFVRGARVNDDGVAIISMTLCSEVCPLGKIIADQARTAIVPSVASDMQLEFTFARRWTPAEISDGGRRHLEEIGYSDDGSLEVKSYPAGRAG
jgi:metal-sulfur cluster biosynthetic enzyme